jgi:hypothetical protein
LVVASLHPLPPVIRSPGFAFWPLIVIPPAMISSVDAEGYHAFVPEQFCSMLL